MNKIEDLIFDNFGWLLIAMAVFIIVCIVLVANKQDSEQTSFMADCMKDHKKYECDVLWSQTDASKQVRDMAIGIGVGAAIGAMSGRR